MLSGIARLIVLGGLVAATPSGALLVAAQAQADQTDKRLPALFAALKKAPSPDAAAAIEARIWVIWLASGKNELDALMAKGVAEMDAEDYDAALADFSTIVAREPGFAEGWNKRATLYYLMGDYKKSLADIDRTLKLEPRHFGALSGLGLVNVQLEHYEDAVQAYERLLKFDPRNAGARHNLDAVRDIIRRKTI